MWASQPTEMRLGSELLGLFGVLIIFCNAAGETHARNTKSEIMWGLRHVRSWRKQQKTEELERTEVKCTQFYMYGKMWNASTHATSLIRGMLCDKQPTNDQIVGIICLVLSSGQQI